MDFTGSIIHGFQRLPNFWWMWLIIIGSVTGLVCRLKRLSTMNVILRALITAYLMFILFQTIIGREPAKRRAKWIPFWSYSHPRLYWEIILNYLLFIPLGVLLYAAYGDKHGLKVVLIGAGLSCLIEFTQLIFKLGLFEFDDIIGNSIGCLIGAVVCNMVVSRIKNKR